MLLQRQVVDLPVVYLMYLRLKTTWTGVRGHFSPSWAGRCVELWAVTSGQESGLLGERASIDHISPGCNGELLGVVPNNMCAGNLWRVWVCFHNVPQPAQNKAPSLLMKVRYDASITQRFFSKTPCNAMSIQELFDPLWNRPQINCI